MSTPREFAFKHLSHWTALANPPLLPERARDTVTPSAPEETPASAAAFLKLSPRDRAFAFDLLTGILRWRNLLDAVIASRLRQPLESLDAPVRALLWLGAYQLLLQSGTTPYAAVDTTVALANTHAPRAGGLVNAVLRGITRLKPTAKPTDFSQPAEARLSRRAFALDFTTEIHLAENVFPDPATALTAHLAAVRSHPALFVDHLRRLYPQQAADLLLRNNVRPVITLRADADALDVSAAAGLVAHASAPRFLVAAEGWNPALESLIKKGTLSPQDPTAARPVRRLAELLAAGRLPALPDNPRILDLCAGLGTKSVQLARTFPAAAITAADIDSVKLARLVQRAREIGQKNITSTAAESLVPSSNPSSQTATFHIVLVDVPCSNTGVMSKRIQSRWRWPALNRIELRALQLRLLQQGAALLPPGEEGGILLYATCSIDPDENGGILREFTTAARTFRVVDEALTLPSLPAPDQPANTPSPHDGGYFAIMIQK
jgi:16S rRNA (cytosine967-C5)-methyltransferase